MTDAREFSACPSSPAASPAEDWQPHTDCAFDHPALAAAVENLAQVDPLPHCGLSHLLDGVFLVPVEAGGRRPRLGHDGMVSLFSSRALARSTGSILDGTSMSGCGIADRPGCRHRPGVRHRAAGGRRASAGG
jgi:hypothetical protein